MSALPAAAAAQSGEPDAVAPPAIAVPVAVELPKPSSSPLTVDFSNDPVLNLARQSADWESFRSIVEAALADSPADREGYAYERVAQARLAEARQGAYPVLDADVGTYRILARKFSNDPDNFVERSRPDRRTDVTAQLQVPVYAFGAIDAAIQSAAARLRAARLQRDDGANQIVVETVVSWSEVYSYQALERLYAGFVAAQDGLAAAIDRRIAEGVSPESDRVQVASIRAEGQVQLARARRSLAAAEAGFAQLAGFAPPDNLKRLPDIGGELVLSRDETIAAAEASPRVKTAEALAEAKSQDARIARARLFPTISTGVEYGRYGILEDRDDYDARATVNLRYRLFGGGGKARSVAASEEAYAAAAAADRTREQAARDAAIAWADLRGLEDQLVALDAAYRAARQSRDVTVARFAALRGSLFDVNEAQNTYLRASSAYIQTLTEWDAARYIMFARTGRLLELMGLDEVGK